MPGDLPERRPLFAYLRLDFESKTTTRRATVLTMSQQNGSGCSFSSNSSPKENASILVAAQRKPIITLEFPCSGTGMCLACFGTIRMVEMRVYEAAGCKR